MGVGGGGGGCGVGSDGWWCLVMGVETEGRGSDAGVGAKRLGQRGGGGGGGGGTREWEEGVGG